MRVLKILSLGIAFIALVVAIAAYVGSHKVTSLAQQPLKLTESTSLMVEPGTSFNHLLEQLTKQQLIDEPLLFKLHARQQNLAHKIKAGEYLLEPGLTHDGLLQLLVQGKVRSYQVTFVEGQRVSDYIARLQSHPQIEKTLEYDDPQQLAKQLKIEGSAEGWIYPDTYQFTRGTTDLALLKRAHQRMQQVLEQEWASKQPNLPISSAYEALILASIVEKETGAAFERPEIAGVFTRRLNKGMRLQTDPTVIYGMGDRYKGNITRADLKRKTPYNTYVIKGLPPTPIANPGREAINAALNPASGKSLYFVAKGDGTHQFSATLAEHNKAVYKYQRRGRRSDYRSSPPPSSANNGNG
ncbi:endolytic transglycosylase MltG [Motiliproteus sp.]|uniref:endolytic transglycosylase MltG n=1 Tax=Motiliproteus sp. TaxID=1898955 RepID=UPI003BAAD7DC